MPIQSDHESTPSGLPSTVLLLHISYAKDVSPPFSLETRSDVPGNCVLQLPQGAGTENKEGSAFIPYRIDEPGKYVPWVHCRWRDSCSNSVSMLFGEETRIIGEDHVFGSWHWVKTDSVSLPSGNAKLLLKEREDGVEIDQLILSREPLFIPRGAYREKGKGTERRLFADDFYRSPGHGMEAWNILSGKWDIQFSLDPNRIPNQYSLSGETEGGEAVCLVGGLPWRGIYLRFNLQPGMTAPAGFLLKGSKPSDTLKGLFRVEEDQSRFTLRGAGKETVYRLSEQLQEGQWHQVVVERWAWILRIFLDGRKVHEEYRLPCSTSRAGLLVQAGQAYFDDVFLEEIQWQAEDGRSSQVSWSLSPGARWYRSPHAGKAIVGRQGNLLGSLPGFDISELLVFAASSHGNRLKVEADPLLLQVNRSRTASVFHQWSAPPGKAAKRIVLSPESVEEVHIERIAFRNPSLSPEPFRIGPYHFSKDKVLDPFDYLDFTQEELAQMNAQEKRDLAQRKPNMRPVVAREGSISLWEGHPKKWTVKEGVLLGKGPHAVCVHSRRFSVDASVDFKARLDSGETAVTVELYAGADKPCPRIHLLSETIPKDCFVSVQGEAVFPVQVGTWQKMRLEADGNLLRIQLNDMDPLIEKIARGDCGQMRLIVKSGQAAFDDVEFAFPRQGRGGTLYAFDRRETDWWRRGGKWIDHGGITCVMASSWISLLASDGDGMLWHKDSLQEGIRLGFDVEAFTDWRGWDQEPNHVHHPYHNVRVCFSPERRSNAGYRLEINAEKGTLTRLFRRDVLLQEKVQDASFPMVFVNQHNPYSPRRNHITATVNEGKVRLLVNDIEILTFQDPDPLPVSALGVGGWNTQMNLAHIEVASGLPF